MRADLPDTKLASYCPDMAASCDSLADQLKDALASFIPPPVRAQAFAALEAALTESDHGISDEDRAQIAHGILRAVYGDTAHAGEIRLIAAAALKRFGKDGRSYQAIGDEFGRTRACVHAHSRRIERRTGLKCRSDKSAEARRTSVEKATGRKHDGGYRRRADREISGVFSVFRFRYA